MYGLKMKLIKFYAPWCQPCKMLDKMLEDYQQEVVVNRQNIDIDMDPDTAMDYKVRGVPTMVLVDDKGTEIRRMVGIVNSQKLAEFLA